MNKKLKLWTGIGTYALVSVGTASPALSEPIPEDYHSLSEDQISTLLSQTDACVAVPVEGGGEGGGEGDPMAAGGEGGEGGESAFTTYVYLPPAQRFQDREILTDFVDEVIVPNYELLTAQTDDLAEAIATFTDNPTEANLAAAREVWIESRIPWEESEAFAFGPAAFLGLDAELDDWPLNEADVIAILESGDPLSPAYVDGLLTSQKGFHAIGYLLFGLDNDKTLADFTERDLEYLTAIGPVLDQTANELLASWTEGVQGYPAFRSEFVTAGEGSEIYPTVQAAGEEITQGIIGILDELGNVKIGEAMVAQNPFLLESRFSQSSLDDFVANVQSAQNVYFGDFAAAGTEGRGLTDFVAAIDPALDAEIREKFDLAMANVQAIPGPVEKTLCDPAAQPSITAAQESVLDLFDIFQQQVLPLVQQ